MRRRGPRPLGLSLAALAECSAPATTLARVQAGWAVAVGPRVARESAPTAERDGVVTVRCSSSVWAHELHLLAPELLTRLQRELGRDAGGVRALRFITGPTDGAAAA